MNLDRRSPTPLILCSLLVAVGLLLRILFPGRMSVEHFDEGVYASNLVISGEYENGYPSRHLFAPPLLPWLIEWSQVALGVNDLASMAVNLLAGVLTVGLAGYVANRWFGPAAALAVTALTALSGVHILYSRTALTDPLLCLWMLAAVYAIWSALAWGDKSWALLAGLLAGLAWWTKYNGWLPLAIGLSAAVPWLVFSGDNKRIRPTIVCLLIICGVAFLVWAPVLWGLPAGYAEVAANHRGYLVGIENWPQTAWRQLTNHRHLEGAVGCLSVGVALLLAAGRRPNWPTLALAIGLTGLAAVSTSSVVLAAIGLYWIWRELRLRRPETAPSEEDSAEQLALWLVTAWFIGLTLTTPLYTPYPRITLPWLVAVWLLGGAGVGRLATALSNRSDRSQAEESSTGNQRRLPAAAIAVVGLLLLAVGIYSRRERLWTAWQPRTSMAQVAIHVKQEIERRLQETGRDPRSDYVVDVYGEPSLYFQIRRAGVELVAPVSTLRFAQPEAPPPTVPTFLLAGPHAQRTPQFQEQLTTAAPRLNLVNTFDYHASDLVRLNDPQPENAPDRSLSETVQLYELR